MKIVSVEQMQAIEKSADAGGLTYEKMMHHAGQGIGVWVAENLTVKCGVVGLVGSGNNGGDTLIALTSLSKRGARTIAFLAKDRDEDPLVSNYSALGGQVVDISEDENLDLLQGAILPGTIILDGILGTGLKLPLRGVLKEVMGDVQGVVKNCPGALVVAVDCPSGMDCDTGEVSEVTLQAEHTLTMAAVKQGLLKHPGRSYSGQLHLVQIGITDIQEHISETLPEMVHHNLAAQYLPERSNVGHKGTFGTCLVIAGSEAFTGAAYLAGKAAYRAGCGLVDIATLEDVHRSLAGQLIEAVWTILPESEGGYDPDGIGMIEENLQNADSLVLGPGLGLSDSSQAFVHHLVEKLPADLPVLIDADGLKLLRQLDQWWEYLPEEAILTPHPGEMAVLSGLTVDEIQSDRWGLAREYAGCWNVTLVLKGAQTVIAFPNGAIYINPVGDPSLATAGSGDVLAGMIGGLLAQGASAKDASIAGVWLHSQAGLSAKRTLGSNVSVIARDILDHVSTVFQD